MKADRSPILSYDSEQRLHALLAGAAETDGLRAPERVEKALVAELQQRNRRILAGRIIAVGSVAAAVLVGLFLMRPTPPPTSAKAPEIVTSALPSPPEISQPTIVKTAQKQRARRRAPKPVQQQLAAIEQRSEFIPVGPWQAMEPMERGSIVRVRLPKSSLPGLGIPVSADRWNESIPADVVLGEDGTMRAVRFINAKQ